MFWCLNRVREDDPNKERSSERCDESGLTVRLSGAGNNTLALDLLSYIPCQLLMSNSEELLALPVRSRIQP